MKKILMQNRIDPSVKEALRRHSQLTDVPMNKLVEQSIMELITKNSLEVKSKLWQEMGSR